MRRVAAFLFSAPSRVANPEGVAVDDVDARVAEWLKTKTAQSFDGETIDVHFTFMPRASRARKPDAVQVKSGRLVRERQRCPSGEYSTWELTEDTDWGGQFRTSLHVGTRADVTRVFATLEAGQSSPLLAPVELDQVRRPNCIPQILGMSSLWAVGPTVLNRKAVVIRGTGRGQQLAEEIRSPLRALPIIVVSEDSGGFVLDPGGERQPNVSERIHEETVGVANVVQVDAEASWALTNTLGQDWGCYHGAIRLYWPRAGTLGPFRNPLWTGSRLLTIGTTSEAARWIADELRRRVYGVSTFAFPRPDSLVQLALECRDHAFAVKLAAAKAANSEKELIDLLEDENRDLRQKVERRAQEVRDLTDQLQRSHTDLANANAMLEVAQFAQSARREAVGPETEAPPRTVAEAVSRARERFAADLVFGKDVEDGIAELAEDAGPPDKILDYLAILARASQAKKAGPLGKDLVRWLKDAGATTTDESKTIKKDSKELKKRTWDNGAGARQVFLTHMKPSDGTSPDRCVRIYFDWDDGKKRYVVGNVGRHPK